MPGPTAHCSSGQCEAPNGRKLRPRPRRARRWRDGRRDSCRTSSASSTRGGTEIARNCRRDAPASAPQPAGAPPAPEGQQRQSSSGGEKWRASRFALVQICGRICWSGFDVRYPPGADFATRMSDPKLRQEHIFTVVSLILASANLPTQADATAEIRPLATSLECGPDRRPKPCENAAFGRQPQG